MFNNIDLHSVEFNSKIYCFNAMQMHGVNATDLSFSKDLTFDGVVINGSNVSGKISVPGNLTIKGTGELIDTKINNLACHGTIKLNGQKRISGLTINKCSADALEVAQCYDVRNASVNLKVTKFVLSSSKFLNACKFNFKEKNNFFSLKQFECNDSQFNFADLKNIAIEISDSQLISSELKFNACTYSSFSFSRNKADGFSIIGLNSDNELIASTQVIRDNELYNQKISDSNFINFWFAYNDFYGLILSDTSITNSKFSDTQFLKNTCFKNCNIDSCRTINFTDEATISKSIFRSSAIAGNETLLKITDDSTVFIDCELRNLTLLLHKGVYEKNFIRCVYKNIKISGKNNLSMDLSGSVLDNVEFLGISELYRCNFDNTKIINRFNLPEKIKVAESIFKGENDQSASEFVDIVFETHVEFYKCDFKGTLFKNCVFKAGLSFSECRIVDCIFQNTQIYGEMVISSSCYISNTSFIKSDLDCVTSILDSKIECLSMQNTSIKDFKIIGKIQEPINIVFNSVILNGTADLGLMDLSDSVFDGITFTGAASRLIFDNSIFNATSIRGLNFDENFCFENNLKMKNVENWQSITNIHGDEHSLLRNILFIQNHSSVKFMKDVKEFISSNSILFFCITHKISEVDYIGFNDFAETNFGDISYYNKIFFACDFNKSSFDPLKFIDCEFYNCYFERCNSCNEKNICVKYNCPRIFEVK